MKTLKKYVLIGLGLGMFAAVPSLFAQTTTGALGSATTIQGSTITIKTPGGATGQLISIGADGSGQVVTIDGYGHMAVGTGVGGGGSLGVGTGGISTSGSASVAGSATLGTTGGSMTTTTLGNNTALNTVNTSINGSYTTINSTQNTTINSGTTNINSNTTIGGAGKSVGVTGQYITVKGNTAIGGTGFNTDITGATTNIGTTNTNITGALTQIQSTTVNLGTSGASVTVVGQSTNLKSVDTNITGNLNASGPVSLAGGSITNPSYSTGSVAMGGGAVVGNGVNAIQIGAGSNTLSNTVQIGGATVNTTVGGSLSVANGLNVNNKVISNVSSGVANSDAVNVGQLSAVATTAAAATAQVQSNLASTNAAVTNLSAVVTTNAATAQAYTNTQVGSLNGSITAHDNLLASDNTIIQNNNIPSITGGSATEYATNAAQGVQTNLDATNRRVNAITVGTQNLAATAGATDILGNLAVSGAVTMRGGADLFNNTISNLLDGAVSATSKDAVNGSQLFSATDSLSSRINAVNDNLAITNTTVANNTAAINAENARALSAETGIQRQVDTNATNIGALQTQTQNISATVGQTNVSGKLTVTGVTTMLGGADMNGTKISNLADGTATSDAVNVGQLTAVATTAATATAQVQTNLNAEITTRTSEVARVDGRIDTTNATVEANRITAATATAQVQTNLNTETARAQAAEASLQSTKADKTAVASEVARVDGRIDTTNAALASETTRAMAAENSLATANANAVSNESSRAQTVERSLDNKITAETQRAKAAEAELRQETRQVGAMALAAAAAAGANPQGDKKSAVTMAVGTYGGYSALSVGVIHMINDRTKVFGSVSGAVNGNGSIGGAIGTAISF